jgi:hypothetical protein
MGPPEGPPEKKAKRSTPLETKLEKLQNTMAKLEPTWGMYDPGVFMESMRYNCKRVGALTHDMVEEFIATGECESLFLDLDLLHPTRWKNLLPWIRNSSTD